jgi:hypothetical protein
MSAIDRLDAGGDLYVGSSLLVKAIGVRQGMTSGSISWMGFRTSIHPFLVSLWSSRLALLRCQDIFRESTRQRSVRVSGIKTGLSPHRIQKLPDQRYFSLSKGQYDPLLSSSFCHSGETGGGARL